MSEEELQRQLVEFHRALRRFMIWQIIRMALIGAAVVGGLVVGWLLWAGWGAAS